MLYHRGVWLDPWYLDRKFLALENRRHFACVSLSRRDPRGEWPCPTKHHGSTPWSGLNLAYDHLMSTQMRTSSGLCGFETITMGDTHGVGPSTGSIISKSKSLCISVLTFCLMWNGILLWRWATGITDSSTCSLTTTLLWAPTPLNNIWFSRTSLSDTDETLLTVWSAIFNNPSCWLALTLSRHPLLPGNP